MKSQVQEKYLKPYSQSEFDPSLAPPSQSCVNEMQLSFKTFSLQTEKEALDPEKYDILQNIMVCIIDVVSIANTCLWLCI